MSIILKGIDLPKETKEVCVMYKDKEGYLQTYIVKDIIQIPKGARLIDANKLEIHRCDDSASRATFDYVDEWDLEDAPTILESEVMPK